MTAQVGRKFSPCLGHKLIDRVKRRPHPQVSCAIGTRRYRTKVIRPSPILVCSHTPITRLAAEHRRVDNVETAGPKALGVLPFTLGCFRLDGGRSGTRTPTTFRKTIGSDGREAWQTGYNKKTCSIMLEGSDRLRRSSSSRRSVFLSIPGAIWQ